MEHEIFVAMHGGMRPTEYIDLGATDLPQVCLICLILHSRRDRSPYKQSPWMLGLIVFAPGDRALFYQSPFYFANTSATPLAGPAGEAYCILLGAWPCGHCWQ